MPIDKTEGLRIGRLFESEFARQAQKLGYFVIRHCEQLGVSGTKAPMLDGPFAGYRLPDYTLMAHGVSFFVEAKYKTKPTPYHLNGNMPQHGIDWPNWEDYLKVCSISGQRGFLVIGEGSTGEILISSFETLQRKVRRYSGRVHFQDGGAFWDRSLFKPWGNFSPQTGQMLFAFNQRGPLPSAGGLFKGDAA